MELFKTNIADYDIRCGFEEASAYLIAQDEDQVKELDGIQESCQKLTIQTGFSNNIPVPLPFIKAMEIPSQAKFSPLNMYTRWPGI